MVNPNISGGLPGHVTGQFAGIDAALRDQQGKLEPYKGVTRDLRTGQDFNPASGYIVSDPGGTHAPHSQYNPGDLGPFVAARQHLLLDPGGKGRLGVFVDEKTVDTDVSRHHAEPRAAFKALRKRGRTASGEMGDQSTEQKSGYRPDTGGLIYNPHHPQNMRRLAAGGWAEGSYEH
jgi:hypothetical protein